MGSFDKSYYDILSKYQDIVKEGMAVRPIIYKRTEDNNYEPATDLDLAMTPPEMLFTKTDDPSQPFVPYVDQSASNTTQNPTSNSTPQPSSTVSPSNSVSPSRPVNPTAQPTNTTPNQPTTTDQNTSSNSLPTNVSRSKPTQVTSTPTSKSKPVQVTNTPVSRPRQNR